MEECNNKSKLVVVEEVKSKNDYKNADNFLSAYFSHLENEEEAFREWQTCPNSCSRLVAKVNNEIVAHFGTLNYSFIVNDKIISGGKFEGSYMDKAKVYLYYKKYKQDDILNSYRIVINELVQRLSKTKSDFLYFSMPTKQARNAHYEAGMSALDIKFISYHYITNKYLFMREKIYDKISNYLKKSKLNIKLIILMLSIIGTLLVLSRIYLISFRAYVIKWLKKNSNVGISLVKEVLVSDILPEYIQKINRLNNIAIYRDHKFIKWRFENNKSNEHNIFLVLEDDNFLAYFVTMKKGNSLYLEDIVFGDFQGHCINEVFRYLLSLKKKKNCNELVIKIQDSKMNQYITKYLSRTAYTYDKHYTSKVFFYASKDKDYFMVSDNWNITNAYREGV